MKYSVHSSLEQAQAEVSKIEAALNIPDQKGTLRYSDIEEHNNNWYFAVCSEGPWKADHIAANLQEIELDTEGAGA